MSNYYLPHATEQLIAEHRQIVEQCKNLSLLLHKYPPAAAIRKNEDKSKWLLTAIAPNDLRTMKPLTPNPHIDLGLLEAAECCMTDALFAGAVGLLLRMDLYLVEYSFWFTRTARRNLKVIPAP